MSAMNNKMRQYWETASAKMDNLALRERVLLFAAAAFLLVSLVNMLFLDPLLAQQKRLSAQVVQQQEKIKEIQAQIEALMQAKKEDANAPQRMRISQLKQQLVDGDTYLQSRRDRLVPPDKMAILLEQVLNKNGRLQLISLQTLPVAPLVEKANKDAHVIAGAAPDQQVYKHGVQITVSGNYLDLLQYLTALEHLPVQMFWGMAKMNVVQYPAAELTLTLYTLSLDKIWLLV
ncbi:MAG: type II secretion system protein GspM [Gallionellaceae bacterium]|nr:type II secretion system protein GspM [Gallionellaceae bacterium]